MRALLEFVLGKILAGITAKSKISPGRTCLRNPEEVSKNVCFCVLQKRAKTCSNLNLKYVASKKL